MAKKKDALEPILTPEQQQRAALRFEEFWQPCTTKEDLQVWLKIFLKVDLPDCQVDELSTSTPFDTVWEIYYAMLTNEGPKRHVTAAARGTSKTLIAATIAFLAIVHFRRDVVHIASRKQQSKKALSYFKKFCRIRELKGHFDAKAAFQVALNNMPKNSYTDKEDGSVEVCAATLEAVNGLRAQVIILDEVDMVSRDVITEAALMAIPTLDGKQHDCISIALSSRKTNDGPLQDRIDEAEAGDPSIRLHKYSLVDWMKKCEESVHGKKGVRAFIHRETLAVSWDELPIGAIETQFLERVVYEGCRKCPAFVACQGRAPNQKSTSVHLKKVSFIDLQLKEAKDPKKIIAQVLNWMPEATGIVFSFFSRALHCKSPEDVWQWMFGEIWSNEVFQPTKVEIYNRALCLGWECVYGVDWGYFPDPAVVLTMLYHPKTERVVLLHARKANYYANHLWAKSIADNENKFMPPRIVCPDMADKASPSYFQTHNMQCRASKPARVEPGVSQIRGMMYDPVEQISKFVIAMFDEEAEWLTQSFMKWRHPIRANGTIDMSAFDGDSEWTHGIDACRYGLDIYIKNQKVSVVKTIADHTVGDLVSRVMSVDEKIENLRNIQNDYFLEQFGILNAIPKTPKTTIPTQAVLTSQGFKEKEPDPPTVVVNTSLLEQKKAAKGKIVV